MRSATLQRVLVERAEEHADAVMPGFTHLQVAQPVTLGHHLMAYYEMLRRDLSRFADARERMNESPLGSAALAGTGFPDRPRADRRRAWVRAADREQPRLPYRTAISRSIISPPPPQCALHLSRLAEELILWASPPFGFVKLSDDYSTGSSIMPQKRNPDAAELVRGHSGRIVGALVVADGDDEGPAARLFEGHAGRQGAGVRGARPADDLASGAGRDGRDGRVRARADARRRGGGLFHRDRSRRLAGARGRRAVPRGASHHRPRRQSWPRSAAAGSPSFRSTI